MFNLLDQPSSSIFLFLNYLYSAISSTFIIAQYLFFTDMSFKSIFSLISN